MIGTIRKHQQWLWVLIIAATIISFVIFFNPSSRYGGGGGGDTRSGDTGASINGRPITAEEFSDARREEVLFYFLQHGEWASAEKLNQQGYQLDQRAYQRIALNEKAKQLGIEPTAKAAARMVEEIFGAKPGENVQASDLERFEQRQLIPNHLSLEDFARFARHQAANQQLVTLFGMSGKLITPKEAEIFFVRENEPMQTEIAYFPLSNYMSQVNVDLKSVQSFFETNKAMYRLPERVQVQYVSFPVSNYTAAAEKQMSSNTNSAQAIDSAYMENGPQNFKDENGNVMSADAAKAKIKKSLTERGALVLAQKDAIAFAQDLAKGHDDDHPFTIDDLTKVAQAQNKKVQVTEPFDMRTGPKELKPSQQFMRTAFTLSTNAPDDKSRSMMYSVSPVQVEDGFVVMGLKSKLPSEAQTFAQVQAKVTDDYKREHAFEMAQKAGQNFYVNAMTQTAQGKSFDSIAAADKVTTVQLPPFSLGSATNLQEKAELKKLEATNVNVAHLVGDRQAFQQLVENSYMLQNGKMSQYIPTPEGGYIIYMKGRLPVDQAKLQKDLPEYVARLREQRQGAAFSEWFQRAAQDMRLTLPPTQQQQMQRQG
jgi:hypothetical protein